MEYLTAGEKNVNEQLLHNLRRIHWNEKEKSHKAVLELIEKILSYDNMNTAYKIFYINKGEPTHDELNVLVVWEGRENLPCSI